MIRETIDHFLGGIGEFPRDIDLDGFGAEGHAAGIASLFGLHIYVESEGREEGEIPGIGNDGIMPGASSFE